MIDMPQNPHILTINGGSSSIKFSVYKLAVGLLVVLQGEIKNINSDQPTLNYTDFLTGKQYAEPIDKGAADLIDVLTAWLEKQGVYKQLTAIGHRVVHGFEHSQPELLTPDLLNELESKSAYDPEHLPAELKLIKTFLRLLPGMPQVLCFDTSFHSEMPAVAKLLPLPENLRTEGLHRYGFHGLSYAYLLTELEKIAGKAIAQSKLIIAHLGSGASLTAIHKGKSVDTSMGFTPSSGLVMSSRTGDLDPGIAWYLMSQKNIDAPGFSKMINHESGLLGVSGISADMKVLQGLKSKNVNAEAAVNLFAYQVKKFIGSFAAVLGGLDTLVFSGGIGENDAAIRESILDDFDFLGIRLDRAENDQNAGLISAADSAVRVYVIKTNEEIMIARSVCTILKYP